MTKSKGLELAKEWLHEQYVLLGKSTTEIATILAVSPPTICYHMKKVNIPVRSPRERKLGSRNPGFNKHAKRGSYLKRKSGPNKLPKGPNHFRYKPPSERIEPINGQIRNCGASKSWKFTVLKRDGFRCVLCGFGKTLEVDHIVPFSAIKKKYKINSLEAALLCDELWNPANGRTLCNSCHKKTDSYGGKTRPW